MSGYPFLLHVYSEHGIWFTVISECRVKLLKLHKHGSQLAGIIDENTDIDALQNIFSVPMVTWRYDL